MKKLLANIAVVVIGSFLGYAGCTSLSGCDFFERSIKNPDTRALIDKCVSEGRNAAIDGAKPEEAAKVFDDCIARGLPKDGG